MNTTGYDPVIYNVELTDADTEYSQVIPNSCHKIELRLREPFELRFSFITGIVATPTRSHNTIKPNETVWEDDVMLVDKILYFACSTAGKTVELRCWT